MSHASDGSSAAGRIVVRGTPQMTACCSVFRSAAWVCLGGGASLRRRVARSCTVSAHPCRGVGQPVAVRGGRAGDGERARRPTTPFGARQIRQTTWSVPARRSAGLARRLGEVLWVSPGRMPKLSGSVRLVVALQPRRARVQPSEGHRSGLCPNEQMWLTEQPRDHERVPDGIRMRGKHHPTR